MQSLSSIKGGFLRFISILAMSITAIACYSCSVGRQPVEQASFGQLQGAQPVDMQAVWPDSIPQDRMQPWEELGADGYVIPAGKGTSAINLESEFIPGVERFSSSGDVNDNGEASRIASQAGTTSQAMYRIPLGGGHPGVVSVDANLLAGKGYYLGLANYGSARWQWYGPFTDNHVRISTALQGPYTSSLGSLFVSVLVHGGGAADVVGIGINNEDAADTTAPPQPSGLAVTPLDGGLLLDWDPVIAGDLAGYRIYHSDGMFSSGSAAGVSHVDSLEGLTQHQLWSDPGSLRYIRVSAIDISGYESPLSDIVSDSPLDGSAPAMVILVDKPSGSLAEGIALTASGADSYDIDVDGDGTYDITGAATGTAQVDTSRLGIIRPRVRGTGVEGTAIAHGSVSLVISGNSRPVAVAISDVASGTAPLAVTFSGTDSTDFDGSIVGGGWDFDGDGTYEVWDDTDIVHVTSAMHTYTQPGTYNAKLRVVDDKGAWDVDTVTVTVSPPAGNIPPVAILRGSQFTGDDKIGIEFSAMDSHDPDGSILDYEWDFDGDGIFNEPGAEADNRGEVNPSQQAYYAGPPVAVGLRVTDNEAATSSTSFTVIVHGWFVQAVDTTDNVGRYTSLAVVDGNPAISYFDVTNTELMYVRAGNPQGSAWGTPVGFLAFGLYTSLAVVDGNPAISYWSDWGYTKFVRASNSQGTAWDAPLDADSGGPTGEYTSLAIVDGNPAISYFNEASGDLKYVRASNPQGTAWNAPVWVDPSSGAGQYTSLAVVDGNPAISYYDWVRGDLKYIRASNAQGSAWNPAVVIETNGDVGQYTSMALVDGYPAISYYDVTNGDLKYVRASDAQGTAWDAAVAIDTLDDVGQYTSLVVVDGNPAISYYDVTDGDLKYVQGGNAQFTSWQPPLWIDSAGIVGQYTSLKVVDGEPAISYYDATNGDLKFARRY
ncbi:MAG: PKD domain-containing protein [Planctomycetales bacterium]|nr:PKD domain-containing protein [bacterium]UNM09693.1 MAG: PKD domain-containing protein [Planctomycetales bacterium]